MHIRSITNLIYIKKCDKLKKKKKPKLEHDIRVMQDNTILIGALLILKNENAPTAFDTDTMCLNCESTE